VRVNCRSAPHPVPLATRGEEDLSAMTPVDTVRRVSLMRKSGEPRRKAMVRATSFTNLSRRISSSFLALMT